MWAEDALDCMYHPTVLFDQQIPVYSTPLRQYYRRVPGDTCLQDPFLAHNE